MKRFAKWTVAVFTVFIFSSLLAASDICPDEFDKRDNHRYDGKTSRT